MTSIKPHPRPAVLVFCRPYLVRDFRDNVAPLADAYEFHFLTDGRSPGTRDTRSGFYARLHEAGRHHGFTPADEADVIARCRYLRNIPGDQALRMVRAMASVIEEEMARVSPVAVLSHMVDDYVTHLTSELARRRGIPYVGYAYSYFPGKIQATLYSSGTAHRLREPGDDEVQGVLELISQRTFRQNYLQKNAYTRLRHLKGMLRYRVKQVVFALKGALERDPLHVHYGCLPFVVERRHWRDFPVASDFHPDWKQRIDAQAHTGRPVVYFPLGYFPESTIDYWIKDRRILNYQEEVLRICTELGRHFRVLVKEHLHMIGGQSYSFYRRLRDIPGVTSVPPLEYSNDALSISDVVLLGAGSIGVEAFVRGKPIASYSDGSYWFAASRAPYLDLADVGNWQRQIVQLLSSYEPPTAAEKVAFIRECLRSTMRTQRSGHRWPICHPDDLRKALNQAPQYRASAEAVAVLNG